MKFIRELTIIMIFVLVIFGNIKITIAQSDVDAPDIEYITIDKHDVSVDDVITVTLRATDETGIAYVGGTLGTPEIVFVGSGDGNYIYVYPKPQEDGTHKATITINSNTKNGEYKFSNCKIKDTLGNYTTYYSKDIDSSEL